MSIPSAETREGFDAYLADLQAVLESEIPMCAQMGIQVAGCQEGRLAMSLPLEANRNHQQTAFAGSLNALCTITGWGTLYLILRTLGLSGNIVIRRSSIKYREPVDATEIVARCQPVVDTAVEHFAEMLAEKGQAKLDLEVVVERAGRHAVSFSGSYVVTQ